jgi:hypothetical protein
MEVNMQRLLALGIHHSLCGYNHRNPRESIYRAEHALAKSQWALRCGYRVSTPAKTWRQMLRKLEEMGVHREMVEFTSTSKKSLCQTSQATLLIRIYIVDQLGSV